MSGIAKLGYLKTKANFHLLDTCPWCTSRDISPIATRGDGLPVLRCNACHLGFLGAVPDDISVFYDSDYYVRSPIPGTAPAVSGYEDYERSFTPSSFRWMTSLLSSLKGSRGRLFDLGAATGTFLEMARIEGFEVHGAELTQEGASAAQEKDLNVRAGLFDPADWDEHSFDVVTALEVLEHVTDLHTVLDGLKQLLCDDGILVFFVPNVSDEILETYGDDALDFNKSFDHTLFFNPAALTRIFEETFGEGALTLFVEDVEQWGQNVSSAFGIVRMKPQDNPPERQLFDIVSGRSAPDAIDTPHDAIAVALAAAKFFKHDLANEALDIATDLGAADTDLATVRAQVLRNRGEILNAIELLERAVLENSRNEDPLAAPLLIETLGDLTTHIGVEEPGLAVGLRQILQRLDASEILERAIDQVEAREADLVDRAAHAEERAIRAEERAIRAEERAIRAEEQANAADRNREHTAEAVRQTRADLFNAQSRVADAQNQAEASSQEADSFRTTLNDIYSSRTWKLASLPWKLQGQLRGDTPPATPPEDNSAIAAPKTAPPARTAFPVTVSVIMPVYDKGRTLQDSIESLRSQTFQGFEVIVWDDGSTDEPTARALREAERLPQVTVVHAANQGVVGARNSAMRLARGEFYVCLDPDDRLRPTYLEKAVLYLKSHPEISIVYPWQQTVGDIEETWRTADLDPSQIATSNHVPVCAVFREGLFTATGGFSEEMSDGFEDWELWTHSAELGYRGRVIPERLFEYTYSHDPSESRDAQARTQIDDIAGRINALHPALDTMKERPFDGKPAPPRLDVEPPSIPPGEGRPVIMMLPWVTVGGADRVVKALANYWTDQGRTVVGLTTLGVGPDMEDRIEDLLEITPYTYQLPSILPKHLWHGFVDRLLDALPDATILNIGSSWFYGEASQLKVDHPELRIIDQQFNDAGHIDDNRDSHAVIDLTIAAYKGLVERFLEDGRPTSEVQEIYVGVEPAEVDEDAVSSARDEIGLPPKKRYATFVGRLSEEKQPEWLIPLADALDPIGVHLVVVGTGPLGKTVGSDLYDHQAITWIKHADDIAAVFAGSELTVLPSAIEGIPLTAMESLSVGTPVVATAVGGLPELSHVTGMHLTDPGDRTVFIDQAISVLTGPEDASIELPTSLTVHGMVERYDAIIDPPVAPGN